MADGLGGVVLREFEDDNGNVVTAINDIQADAFERAGFTEVETTQRRGRRPKAETE